MNKSSEHTLLFHWCDWICCLCFPLCHCLYHLWILSHCSLSVHNLYSGNSAFKRTVRMCVTLWCHNKAVIALGCAPNPWSTWIYHHPASCNGLECLPEICNIFFYSITQRAVSQPIKRETLILSSDWLTVLLLLALQRGVRERGCKTIMTCFLVLKTTNTSSYGLTLQINHQKSARFVYAMCSCSLVFKPYPKWKTTAKIHRSAYMSLIVYSLLTVAKRRSPMPYITSSIMELQLQGMDILPSNTLHRGPVSHSSAQAPTHTV